MGYPGVFGVLVLVVIGVWVAAGSTAVRAATEPAPRIVGMYVHQHWPYRHPYAARTWTVEDWRGYLDGLRRLGFNTVLVWPMLETMPDPLTPSDERFLKRLATVVDIAHRDFGMRVYLALCPNVGVDDRAAGLETFEDRRFFSCDVRVNPADTQAVRELMDRRERLLRMLSAVDGVSIIDSDPGGYPGSTNQEFVELLGAHRRMLDRVRPGIELVYWMHAGWLGYNRFYQTGVLTFSTDEENLDVLTRLMRAAPEPWGLANGLHLAEQLGIADRVISYNYGRIEGEPSFPLTNFGGNYAWEGGAAPGPRGVMGNAQTHCVQLPNTFAFARGALGQPVAESDYVDFADRVLPGLGPAVVQAWTALAGEEPSEMRTNAEAMQAASFREHPGGPLAGLLFGSASRFLSDLAMMLRMRAAYVELKDPNTPPDRARVRAFAETAGAWQAAHGYENSWWWPDLEETLRRIGSPEVNAVLDTQMRPFDDPGPLDVTPFEYVANHLRNAESYTPRLLATLRQAAGL